MKKFIQLQVLFLLICANVFAGEGKKALAPTADFTVSSTQGCAPLTVTFTSTSTSPGDPIVSYEWDFGDGTPVVTTTLPTVSHTYTTTGPELYDHTFDVMLTVTTASSAIDIALKEGLLYVNAPDLGPDLAACADELFWTGIELFPKLPGGFSVVWSPNSLGYPDSYVCTVYDPGEYWIEVTDPGTGCVRRDTIVITEKPSISINYSVTQAFNCGGQANFEFKDQSVVECGTPTLSYIVNDGKGGPILDGPNFDITYYANGTYNVTVTVFDDNTGQQLGQLVIPVTVTLADANPMTPPNPGPDKDICPGGSVTLDAGYETGAIYSWSPATGLSNPNIHNPVASPGSTEIYTVTKIKCYDTQTATVTVNVGTGMSLNLGPDADICPGATLTLNTGITGGTTTWSSSTDPGFGAAVGNSPTATVSQPGTYSVTVVKDGCTATDQIVITAQDPITSGFSSSQTGSCATLSVAFTDATVLTCGSNPTYVWNFGDGTVLTYPNATNAQKNPSHTYTAPGTYTVTLIVSVTINGVTSSDTTTHTVTITGTAVNVNLGADRAICSGNSVTLDAGNTGATYNWSTGATTRTISVSTTGSYWVEVTNGACTGRDTVNVTVTTSPVVNLGPDESICSGTNITLDAGNFPGATYVWNTGATTRTINVNTTNSYTVTVTLGGCSGTDTKFVDVKPTPSVNLGPDQNVCPGSNVTLDAGTYFGATYLWNTGYTHRVLNTTTPGTYSVAVALNGCVGRDTVVITHSTAPTVNLGADFSLCAGATRILTAPAGYSAYLWSNGATTNSITVNSAGTYWVRVTGSGGCEGRDTVVATAAAAPIVNLGADFSLCAGATRTLTAPAGHSAYLWSNGATGASITVSTAGTYWVRVTNAAGCEGRDTVVATTATAPVVNLGADFSLCTGATRTLTAPAGHSAYLWSNGSTGASITVSTAGTYWVRVTNTAGCEGRDTVVATTATAPVVNLGADFSLCAGETRTLNAPAGFASYLWNDNSTGTSITVNAAGTYWVRVTNAAGCESRDTVAVTTAVAPTVSLGADFSLCSGDTRTLTAPAGFASYLWSNNATGNSITVNGAGTYWVRVTNAAGCEGRDTVVVTTAAAPTVNLGPDFSLCLAETRTLTAPTGFASYLWSTGATGTSIPVSSAGTYWVRVANAAGCERRDTVVVTMAPIPSVDLGPDFSLCPGESRTLTAPAGFSSYQWSNGEISNSITITHPGIYWIRVTNAAGCEANDAVVVTMATPPSVSLGADFSMCDGETRTLTAPAGFSSYLWSNNATTSSITINGAGSYWVRVTNATGCEARDTVVVTSASPAVSLGADFSLCGGASSTLTVPAGFSAYEWSTGATGNSITVTTPGTYWVRVTNAAGCETRDTVAVTEGVLLTVDLGKDTTICPGSSLTLDAGNHAGATYLWSNNETTRTIDVTTGGNYYVDVTAGGCTSRGSVNVTVSNTLTVDLGNDTTVCAGSSVTLDAGHPGATYLWSNGETGRTITINPTVSTTYTVAVSDGGCTGNGEITVNVSTTIPVSLGDDATICPSESLVLDAGYPGASYLWHDNVTTRTRVVTTPGEYSVTVTDGGCTGTASINISLIEAPVSVDLGDDAILCFGNSLTLNAEHPGASYLWSTGATTPTIVVSSSNTYWVDVTACGVTERGQVVVTASNTPVPTITESGNMLTVTEGDSYQWYKGGELIPGATGKTLKPKGYGLYSVAVGHAVCPGEASYFFVPSGNIYLGDIRVKVTPNPSYGQPKLVLSKLPNKPIQVSIYDRIGRKVLITHIVNTVNEINLTAFAKGEYFAEMVLGDDRVIVPIITQ